MTTPPTGGRDAAPGSTAPPNHAVGSILTSGWLAGVLMVLLLVPLTFEVRNRVIEAWWDFAHLPVMVIIAATWLRRVPGCRGWLALPFFVVVIEWIQHAVGRDFSWLDIGYGWLGCLVGACWIHGTQVGRPARRTAVAVGAVAVAAGLFYPLWLSVDEWRAMRAYPALSTFDTPLEKSRWVITGCEIAEVSDGWRVTIAEGYAYPGIFLRSFARDWTTARSLCLEVYLDGEQPVALWVRVDDLPDNPAYADRFQRRFQLLPGPNRVCVHRSELVRSGSGQPLNLSAIRAAGLFFEPSDAGRSLTLYRLYIDTSGAETNRPVIGSGH